MPRAFKTFSHTGIVFLAAVAAGSSQQQSPDERRPVIEITTNLVPVDAVVTDSQGRAVTDLTRNDFQILQDGTPQPITAFSLISAGPKFGPDPGAVQPPSREQVRRTIVFAVDDFTIARPVPGSPTPNFRALTRVRYALLQFFGALSWNPENTFCNLLCGTRTPGTPRFRSSPTSG